MTNKAEQQSASLAKVWGDNFLMGVAFVASAINPDSDSLKRLHEEFLERSKNNLKGLRVHFPKILERRTLPRKPDGTRD